MKQVLVQIDAYMPATEQIGISRCRHPPQFCQCLCHDRDSTRLTQQIDVIHRPTARIGIKTQQRRAGEERHDMSLLGQGPQRPGQLLQGHRGRRRRPGVDPAPRRGYGGSGDGTGDEQPLQSLDGYSPIVDDHPSCPAGTDADQVERLSCGPRHPVDNLP